MVAARLRAVRAILQNILVVMAVLTKFEFAHWTIRKGADVRRATGDTGSIVRLFQKVCFIKIMVSGF
jgi:hypothetical protein